MEKRGVRLIVGALMPAAVGAGVFFIFTYIGQTPEQEETGAVDLMMFFYLLVLAYALVGVQSIICSIVMEFIVNPMFSNHFTVVGISIVLGALSGGVIASIGSPVMVIIGAVPGLVTGLYLR